MKPIKFDLPLNGTRIATLSQLEENLTPEILEPFRLGRLVKWLRVRQLTKQAEAVEALLVADNEHKVQLLKVLYQLFSNEIDEDLLRIAVTEHKQALPSSQENIDTEIELIKYEHEREINRLKNLHIKKFEATLPDGTDENLLRKAIADLKQELSTSQTQIDYEKEIKQLKNLHIDQFIANYHGTATDTTTDLIWSRYAVGQCWENGTAVGEAKIMNWHKAMEIEKTFNKEAVGGFTNWRLPTLNELQLIVERDKNPSINQSVFVKAPQIGFWSSSLHDSNDNNYACIVDFCNGSTSKDHIDKNYAVRLVRKDGWSTTTIIECVKKILFPFQALDALIKSSSFKN